MHQVSVRFTSKKLTNNREPWNLYNAYAYAYKIQSKVGLTD